MTQPPEESKERVRRVLERELAKVDTPQKAEAVVERVERLASGATEEEAEAAAEAAPSAAEAIERTEATAPPGKRVAAVLAETAAQAVGPTAEAGAVMAAAQEALGTVPAGAPPATERGRSLLKEAVLRRMKPLQALDARLFLAVNGVPHPRWLDAAADTLTIVTTGGWIWVGGAFLAALLGGRRGRLALREALPTVACVTWIVEHPVKAYFRRRRPFIDVVRALVVGKRPGSWSFPSGHTASSFAGATVLTCFWPRAAPLFYLLASLVGLSRIYVGAHYPGDVLSGAGFGLSLSLVVRQLVRHLLGWR
jgi:undecaprenyl-diphosphatase